MNSVRALIAVLVMVGGLLHASVSSASAADAHFAGEVLINGKPMAGKVALHLDDQFVGAKVKADGKFKVQRVLIGKCKVTLEGKGVPKKYTAEDSTPLIIEVRDGANWFKFDL